MEILKDVKIDWLGKKWYFAGLSLVLALVGAVAYFVNGGLAYGIDFTGGTIVYLKFAERPDLDLIRRSLRPETLGATQIQRYDTPEKNSVLVRAQTVVGEGRSVDETQIAIRDLLRKAFDPQNTAGGKPDFNAAGLDDIGEYLIQQDPDGLKSQNKTADETQRHYKVAAQSLLEYRDRTAEGLAKSLDDLKAAPGVSASVVESVKKTYYAGPFAVKGVESVGAIVGADLRRRAILAVGLSLLGMLVYIGFRFKPIYGVAAVVAVFHDVVITLGLIALAQKEISLTIIAAFLTLIGYSMNDTIVIFDRARENLRLMRKDRVGTILNTSINQTLARTIMTSGTTFISVLALYIFGGEVLDGFSFVLVVGIIIGTYSSMAIASPIVDWWDRLLGDKPRRKGV